MNVRKNLEFGFPVRGRKPFFKRKGELEEKVYWKDFLARKHGLHVPRMLRRDTEATFDARMDRYTTRYFKVMEDYGCELMEGGEENAPEYFVTAAIAGPEYFSGSSRYIRPLDVEDLLRVREDPELCAKLRRFCKALGLRYRTPKWYSILSISHR